MEGLETIWMGIEVTDESITRLKQLTLLTPNFQGRALTVSLRSLYLDAEMRFRVNRAFLGDADEYPVAGLYGNLASDSIETLTPVTDDQLRTWDPQRPPATVTESCFMHSLLCPTFEDEYTQKYLSAFEGFTDS